MKFQNNLVLTEVDEYRFAELNMNVKFTPVMEEVLLTLQLLFILNFTCKFVNIVGFLCRFLDRSPNAIGSSLKSLANLGLITYYRSGRRRVVDLQLDHPFLSSALFRFFGFNAWLANKLDSEDGCSDDHSFGFLPSAENVPKFLTFLQLKERTVDKSIAEYQEWFEWVKKIKRTIAYAKDSKREESDDYDDNSLQLFSEEVVSRINQVEITRANDLNDKELIEIILSVFTDYQELPPWLDESSIGPHSLMVDDFILEKRLHENR